MVSRRFIAIGAGLVLAAQQFVCADAFQARRVPTAARWVLHLDMDAARPTKLWETLNQKLSQNDDYRTKVEGVEQLTGMHFPEDMHDVTLYGSSVGDNAGTVVIHASIDRDKAMTAVQGNPSFKSEAYRTYQIITWDDNGVRNFGAFHSDDLLIVARSEENVQTALDTIDGKTESIHPDSPLAAGAKPEALLYVAAKELSELKKENVAQSPLIKQIDHAWISLSERGDNALVRGTLTAQTPELTTQIVNSLNGVKAMVWLAANNENADANAKNASAALSTLVVSQQENSVKVDWPIGMAIIRAFLDKTSAPAAPAPAASK